MCVSPREELAADVKSWIEDCTKDWMNLKVLFVFWNDENGASLVDEYCQEVMESTQWSSAVDVKNDLLQCNDQLSLFRQCLSQVESSESVYKASTDGCQSVVAEESNRESDSKLPIPIDSIPINLCLSKLHAILDTYRVIVQKLQVLQQQQHLSIKKTLQYHQHISNKLALNLFNQKNKTQAKNKQVQETLTQFISTYSTSMVWPEVNNQMDALSIRCLRLSQNIDALKSYLIQKRHDKSQKINELQYPTMKWSGAAEEYFLFLCAGTNTKKEMFLNNRKNIETQAAKLHQILQNSTFLESIEIANKQINNKIGLLSASGNNMLKLLGKAKTYFYSQKETQLQHVQLLRYSFFIQKKFLCKKQISIENKFESLSIKQLQLIEKFAILKDLFTKKQNSNDGEIRYWRSKCEESMDQQELFKQQIRSQSEILFENMGALLSTLNEKVQQFVEKQKIVDEKVIKVKQQHSIHVDQSNKKSTEVNFWKLYIFKIYISKCELFEKELVDIKTQLYAQKNSNSQSQNKIYKPKTPDSPPDSKKISFTSNCVSKLLELDSLDSEHHSNDISHHYEPKKKHKHSHHAHSHSRSKRENQDAIITVTDNLLTKENFATSDSDQEETRPKIVFETNNGFLPTPREFKKKTGKHEADYCSAEQHLGKICEFKKIRQQKSRQLAEQLKTHVIQLQKLNEKIALLKKQQEQMKQKEDNITKEYEKHIVRMDKQVKSIIELDKFQHDKEIYKRLGLKPIPKVVFQNHETHATNIRDTIGTRSLAFQK
ncbi:hypothetical protein RFI_32291 [Reticulomyxa filosa]|uniref:Uncharacterized protein n=1 Tax=Reticulomyxa filosa TaxID=46433 RepID=X6LWK0_RETFI|nr:hypothetical protein RFI_32291 [Reticulomyxa filosa]|eukprot:ETO05105.1 hypothetical protein RFI_32291 [Reticulomyxa filosa]